MSKSSSSIKELQEATRDFFEAIKSDRFKSQTRARKILLSNKLNALSRYLDKVSQDSSIEIERKIDLFSEIQEILEKARSEFVGLEQSLTYWETINLIQFINLRKATMYFFDERRKIITSASMLTEILFGQNIDQIPELPSPVDPDFRRILSISLNILTNTAGIYELAIENLQILDLTSFVKWTEIILDSYQKQFQIWDLTKTDEVRELYSKNRGIIVYLQNEIIKAFSLENLGYLLYLMELLRPLLPSSIFDHPIFDELKVKSYRQYLDYVVEEIQQIRKKVEQSVIMDTSIKIEDITYLDDLDNLLDLNKLRLKNTNYLDLPSIQISQLILDWYSILNKIKKNDELSSDWFSSELGQIYLATFFEFVYLIAIEGVSEPLIVFQERLNGFSELLENIPIAEYTSLFQFLTIIELYVRLSHEDYSSLERNFHTIWRIRNEVELNLTLFVENSILQTLLGYYTEMLSETQIVELLEDTMKIVNEVMQGETFVKDFTYYVDNFLKAIKGQDYSFEILIGKRMQIDDLDPATWLIPDFSNLAKLKGKPFVPFIPFNRKIDKFYK